MSLQTPAWKRDRLITEAKGLRKTKQYQDSFELWLKILDDTLLTSEPASPIGPLLTMVSSPPSPLIVPGMASPSVATLVSTHVSQPPPPPPDAVVNPPRPSVSKPAKSGVDLAEIDRCLEGLGKL